MHSKRFVEMNIHKRLISILLNQLINVIVESWERRVEGRISGFVYLVVLLVLSVNLVIDKSPYISGCQRDLGRLAPRRFPDV